MSETNEQTEGKTRKKGIQWKQKATVVTKSFEANGHSYSVDVSPEKVVLKVEGPECSLTLNAKPGLDTRLYMNTLARLNNLVVGGDEVDEDGEEGESSESGDASEQGGGAEQTEEQPSEEGAQAEEPQAQGRRGRGRHSAEA